MNIINDIDLRRFMARQESQSIRPAMDFFNGAMERLQQGNEVFGDQLPWSKTADKFRFRPKELTIWAGVNGNGKSLVMGQAALWLAAAKKKVLIASMEMPGEATVARMLRQGCGVPLPARDCAEGLMSYTRDSIWIYDQLGSVKPDQIIAMIHWSAEELGINHVMIDSLVKCGVTNENEPQKQFVDALAWAAKVPFDPAFRPSDTFQDCEASSPSCPASINLLSRSCEGYALQTPQSRNVRFWRCAPTRSRRRLSFHRPSCWGCAFRAPW